MTPFTYSFLFPACNRKLHRHPISFGQVNQPKAVGAVSTETLRIRATQEHISLLTSLKLIFFKCQGLEFKGISYYFPNISNLERCELHTHTLPSEGISV